MQTVAVNIVQSLMDKGISLSEKNLFILTGTAAEDEQYLSYKGLSAKVRQLAAYLNTFQLYGKTVLLVYQDVPDFITAFLACQYVGIIPVPVPFVKGTRQRERLSGIIDDAQAAAVLCCDRTLPHIDKGWLLDKTIRIISTDNVQLTGEIPLPTYHELAFIQYTSGSTGNPRGVMVSHSNLMHNQQVIRNTFGCDENSVIFSWLPFHHDMGLIGCIIHAIYTGCTAVLMSPFRFMQDPLKWLEAIGRYKVTHSGGPNFAYDLCVEKITSAEAAQLDLSSWKVAFNGAEPLRADTLGRFTAHFSVAGFRPQLHYPCYGLAEATLMVSGKRTATLPLTIKVKRNELTGKGVLEVCNESAAPAIVSSGPVAEGMLVKIVGADGEECGELEAGEICVAGESVTAGYWRKDNKELFYIDQQQARYLRTGDNGFFYGGELFVHGRLKEMLILRGKNIYPYDIEQTVAESSADIVPNGVAVFNGEAPADGLIVIAEMKRTSLRTADTTAILAVIDRAVAGTYGITPYDIVLTSPQSIPRTTSGKLQRLKCCSEYQQQALKVIATSKNLSKNIWKKEQNTLLLAEAVRTEDYPAIKAYIIDMIECVTGRLPETLTADTSSLTEMGLDSLRALELVTMVNKDLGIHVDPAGIFSENTVGELISTIEQLLWLNNKQNSGEEITI